MFNETYTVSFGRISPSQELRPVMPGVCRSGKHKFSKSVIRNDDKQDSSYCCLLVPRPTDWIIGYDLQGGHSAVTSINHSITLLGQQLLGCVVGDRTSAVHHSR